jgi:hypothetical protein
MKHLILFLFFIPISLLAQPNLKPHIGLSAKPQNSDSVCNIPVYQGDFNSSGYQKGENAADFTLYKPNGDSIRLSNVLSAGKPVLLVAGSYTCPVFRKKIPDINSMAAYYNGQLEVYIVYVVEAHPVVDVSPYSGQVWVTSDNTNEGVLYEQPETYGERLEVIDSMLAKYTVNVDILVDGPCNNWWLNYGPAPNNAYLIDTNGKIFAKQGWYNKAPENMWCEIDSMLGTNSGNCIATGNNGTFSVMLTSADSVGYESPGNTISIYSTITNLSNSNNVELNIGKLVSNIPSDWQTALCADICYNSSVNTINVTIPPAGTQQFIFYFYTGPNPDSGSVQVRFRNNNNSSNKFYQTYIGVTTNATSLNEINADKVSLFPNPASDFIKIKSQNSYSGKTYIFYDASGKPVLSGLVNYSNQLNISKLAAGIYYLKIGNDDNHSYIFIKQ